jgi:hypothetical protein
MSLPKKEKFQLDKKCSDTHASGTTIELISQKLLIVDEFVTFMSLYTDLSMISRNFLEPLFTEFKNSDIGFGKGIVFPTSL